MRFEEDITYYTLIDCKLNEKEIIKNGGIIFIGGYCRCRDKINYDCLEKIIKFLNKLFI